MQCNCTEGLQCFSFETSADLKSSVGVMLKAASVWVVSRQGCGWDVQGQSVSTSDKLHSELTTSMILYSIYMYNA